MKKRLRRLVDLIASRFGYYRPAISPGRAEGWRALSWEDPVSDSTMFRLEVSVPRVEIMRAHAPAAFIRFRLEGALAEWLAGAWGRR